MRGQLRDAKIAYAIENHPKKPRVRIRPSVGLAARGRRESMAGQEDRACTPAGWDLEEAVR